FNRYGFFRCSTSFYNRPYFYDEWDLKITEKKSGESVFVDVKTAETEKSPQHYWNFLYPVIQNQRSGKDYVVLCYYYKTAQFPRIILAGYIPEAEIAQKPVLKAGTRIRFGTLNQIDNYETRLTDYHPIAGLIDYLTKGRDLL
ncbi:MAG: hypothetical protein LUE31_06950, partial [Lachnospiraceae bacterium]|nr:hypothetical protein [Lachnospiraceae bacterium]